MARNAFESNEDRDIDALGGEGPAVVLPALESTHEYVLQKLPSGKVAVITQETGVRTPKKAIDEGIDYSVFE
ncbi:hypothetical protein [Streptomyces phage Psst1]|nr:hypothetical protein [Streptomyces phage Psst1]WPJ30672.1 hypothetical protein [Streptomyces phage Psst2]